MGALNGKYDKIVCINLRERPAKKEYMEAMFHKYNILDVEFYHPVILGYADKFVNLYADKYNKPENNYVLFNKQFPNEFGTMHSHYHVIKTALLEGVENLFVFEDDCAFRKDWNTMEQQYLDSIPENADGILLYSFMDRLLPENVRVNARWTKGYMSWSLLAYGMNKKAMEGFVNFMDNVPEIADKATWSMMSHYGYNFYVASPPLVLPSRNFNSDIRGENKNYDKIPSIFTLGINQEDYYSGVE